ncbi:NodB homology domain-containing protein [Mucor velutinosus]|uniref:NodB homology domain-containing protein n=1 Tax=Mucor velutinosus TaxID=708070 RepID=A0AAN7DS42_9FUNG|nr:NodB homology domain-containing protein [Mucor velutinosus]
MSKFTRPTFNVDDDDLERLQKEFFEKETMPSARVYRTNAPPSFDKQPEKKKKRSLFAERLANTSGSGSSNPVESSMPDLEMPSLEEATPALESARTVVEDEQEDEYEPVMDPHPEPHVPVSKKMIDLTSLLGQVLGEIKEHDVKQVIAPTLPSVVENKPARGQVNGFPKPVHRSEFKKRLEAQRNKSASGSAKAPRPEAPPQVISEEPLDENDRRIQEMSQQELEDARQEIMNTLSPESIALLMKGLKNKGDSASAAIKQTKKVSFEEPQTRDKEADDDKEDLLQIKKEYFANVPLENEKLAWIDNRFLTSEIRQQEAQRLKELEEENSGSQASEVEKVYRKVRFDLQGRIIDQTQDIPRHKGLHHHGDEPDKAGYTLAELFYLVRSQVPSQRSMVLTMLARIITLAKKAASTEPVWNHVLSVFTGKEHTAAIYLRSALDDRNLIVLVSAIKALAALVLDDYQVWEASLIDSTEEFNKFLGHIARPTLPPGVTEIKRKGLNDKLTELVDRVRQTSGQPSLKEQQDDAALAERDLMRGLVKMDLLARIRYLLASDSSELIQYDAASVDRLVRIVVRMAEAGQDVCEAIEEEELLEPIVHWGVANTQWPMTEDAAAHSNYPSLAAVRLLTVLAQGSKQIAESIVEKATITLRFLVTSPDTACNNLKRRAYALQLETLKLVRVLACYGFIVPTLEDLQGPLMGWLRSVLGDDASDMNCTIASTAIGLLEVLLYAAADPHKTVPAHAIDWHQPTAYLPAITAVVRSSRDRHQSLYESALGYLGTWASHIALFPPELETVRQVWKAVIQEDNNFQSGNSVALGYTTSMHHVLRYLQFIAAFTRLDAQHALYSDMVRDAKCRLRSAQVVHLLKECYAKDMLGRYALYIWLDQCKEREKCWGMSLRLAELEAGIRSKHIGTSETWLAQELLHLCLSSKQQQQALGDLEPFYLDFDQQHVNISKALFDHDGRSIKTLMYTSQGESESNSLETTAFILSPIDALYHLDKSKVAQQCRADAASIVSSTIGLANKLFYTSDINHDVAVITLMKIFLIGDREGKQADMTSEREVFRDDRVSQDMDQWLNYLCRTKTNLAALENAWRRSSEHIRQAQVPFFQFYQGFVAQYAAVSFGHHGFARLLVYLVTQIDTIDYRHLVLSDYRDILATLKVGVNQVPQLTFAEKQELDNAGLRLLDSL